jgi:enoyl reductase-like protein
MAGLEPLHSQEQFANRGRTIFEREICPRLGAQDNGKFVAIDIVTGAHELDRDDRAATERLLARYPDAQIWMVRVGERTAYRIGGRPAQVLG